MRHSRCTSVGHHETLLKKSLDVRGPAGVRHHARVVQFIGALSREVPACNEVACDILDGSTACTHA